MKKDISNAVSKLYDDRTCDEDGQILAKAAKIVRRDILSKQSNFKDLLMINDGVQSC